MFEFKLPDLGEGIHEGELIKWYVKKGDRINEDDPLCDLETDKATVTIPSPKAGVIARLVGKPGETIPVNSILVVIDEKGDGRPNEGSDPTQPETSRASVDPPSDTRPKQKVVAAPATRRMAREMGIDIQKVPGSGPAGKVTQEDLKTFIENKSGPREQASLTEMIPENEFLGGKPALKPDLKAGIPFFDTGPLPDFESQGPVQKEPVRSLRKKTAVKTTSSMIMIPHVAHMDECDVTELETLRKAYNDKRRDSGKLTLMVFVIKAAASLLKDYPEFNASLDTDKMEIIYKKFFHIGFAADTPKGLMVPVIKHADNQSIIQLAKKVQGLADRGREGTITVPELSNGTFTVTNVGAIGGTGMVPTINYPESAILGMGRVVKKPVVRDDSIVVRKILPITLCFDHRIADGAQAARFVNRLKQMLEDPFVLMTGI